MRWPVGMSAAVAEQSLTAALGRPGIKYRVLRRFEPSYTDPGSEIVRRCAAAAREVVGG